MANKFEITKEIMENANTYMPIALKEVLATSEARECIKETRSIHSYNEEDSTDLEYGLAPVYCENLVNKARVMMSCLMAHYLKVWDGDAPIMCSLSDYDELAGAHVLNQIERFKSGEYREKAFDILSDYREMERYLNSAIYSVLREMNDPAKRILSALGEMGSADAIQGVIEELQKTQDGLKEEVKRQEEIVHGADGNGEDGEENGGRE